jgi:hypothetical protein
MDRIHEEDFVLGIRRATALGAEGPGGPGAIDA